MNAIVSSLKERPPIKGFDDLLLREVSHRSGNDMQLVASLLALQSRHCESPEARRALDDVHDRVMILARSRAAFLRQERPTLEAALQEVCAALQSQAEPHDILIAFQAGTLGGNIAPAHIIPLALAVNELVTNALKHAFKEGASGRITISMHTNGDRTMVVTVDDDGLPLPPLAQRTSGRLGLGLVRRLVEMTGGLIILPENGGKCFEIRVPLNGL